MYIKYILIVIYNYAHQSSIYALPTSHPLVSQIEEIFVSNSKDNFRFNKKNYTSNQLNIINNFLCPDYDNIDSNADHIQLYANIKYPISIVNTLNFCFDV